MVITKSKLWWKDDIKLHAPHHAWHLLPRIIVSFCLYRANLLGTQISRRTTEIHSDTSKTPNTIQYKFHNLKLARYLHFFCTCSYLLLCLHVLVAGSYTSTLFRTKGPSWPPTAYNKLFNTPTPIKHKKPTYSRVKGTGNL